MLWRPTKAKRYFRAHQLFKWSIEVMRIFLWSLLPRTRKMKQAYKISGFTTLQKSYSEALPYEIPHQVRQHAFECRDSPKQWSSHFSYDFWVLFTENLHVKKDKIFALITASLLSFLCLLADSGAGIDMLEQPTP